jgi:glycerophosphoryl diester phosphodiesterase
MSEVLVAAHRGLSAEYPENTLAALRAAARGGFPAVELDVRVTHDHELVILHDASIDRTTDGSGRVAEMDYDELRRYDTGEGPVPRLDDVLDALGDWPGLWDIELKAPRIATAVAELVEHHGIVERTLITAMNPRSLRPLLRHEPRVQRGLIVLGEPDEQDIAAAEAAGCTWLLPSFEHMLAERVAAWQDRGFQVGTWTVNDPVRAQALAKMGVDLIITDTSQVLREVPHRFLPHWP